MRNIKQDRGCIVKPIIRSLMDRGESFLECKERILDDKKSLLIIYDQCKRKFHSVIDLKEYIKTL